MIRISKYYIFITLTLLFMGLFSGTQKAYAQTCGGTSSTSCGSAVSYTCAYVGNNPNDAYCLSSSVSDAGYACGAFAGSNSCVACVPNDQTCQVGNYNSATGFSTTCTFGSTVDGCNTCDISWNSQTGGGCGNASYKLCTYGCTNYCTTTPYTNCSTCSGGTEPTNTCGYTNGGYSCQYGGPSPCTPSGSVSFSCNNYYNVCASGFTCPNSSGYQVSCVSTIKAHVFNDYNHNGVQDTGEANMNGITVSDGSTSAPTDSYGNVTFSGLTAGTYTITATVPSGYKASTTDPLSVSLSTSTPNPTANFGMAPLFSISGHVYVDYNHDGSQNNGEPNYLAGISVSDGKDTTTTDANGNFTLPQDLISGTYTVSLPSIPAGYKGVITSQSVSVGPSNGTAALSITPLYQISGNIFNDVDQSHCYNPSTSGCTYQGYTDPPGSDTLFTNGSHLKITGTTTGTISTAVDASGGVYQTTQSLPSGTYTVAYDTGTTPLPLGYRFVGPSSWQVVVGNQAGIPACSPGASPDGKCGNPNNGSLSNLNFGVTNENAWAQPVCSDARFNSGYSQIIPSTASCGGTSAPYAIMNTSQCTTNPGILFSGSTNPYYGQGTGASTSNYQVGNFSFPESYNYQIPNTSATSYSFVNTSLNTYTGQVTPLQNICPSYSTNCTLSEATPGCVYTATGPVSFSVSNVDGTYNLGKANYVFIVSGNITFTTSVLTQNGYSTTFISAQDIHVAGNVGESSWTSTTPDLEGFFSADNNFILDSLYPAGQQCTSAGQPRENKLNILGSVITNAGGAGGTVVNNRDGCLQDLSCPAITVTSNPVMILNASGLLKPPYTFWQEQNP